MRQYARYNIGYCSVEFPVDDISITCIHFTSTQIQVYKIKAKKKKKKKFRLKFEPIEEEMYIKSKPTTCVLSNYL